MAIETVGYSRGSPGGQKNTIFITVLVFSIYFPAYFLIDDSNPARYFMYIVPLLALSEHFIRNRAAIYRSAWMLLGVFSVIYGFGVIQNGLFGLKEYLFVFLSIFTFAIPFRTQSLSPSIILFCGFSLAIGRILFYGSASPSISLFASSRGVAESSFGLVMPLLAIVFYLKRRWIGFLLAILVAWMMFKRIALAGLALALALDYVLMLCRPGCSTERLALIIRLILLICAVAISLNSLQFYEWVSSAIYSLFEIRFSPNQISSGRYYSTSVFLDFWREDLNLLAIIFGKGPGFSTKFLQTSPILIQNHFPLLHNDFLRILVDYGAIGLLGVCIGFVWAFKAGRTAAAFATYTLVLFMTDNAATYLVYWISCFFLIRSQYLDHMATEAISWRKPGKNYLDVFGGNRPSVRRT